MTCKPAPRWRRLGVAAVSWAMAAWLAEGAVGADLERPGRKLEERIEMQLRGGGSLPEPPKQPERTHDDSIEPWELVPV
jgi:hypothetical protein